ncbi:MAG TPA: cytochrome C oxidase subunit IV family protein [Terriglobales bacterium]
MSDHVIPSKMYYGIWLTLMVLTVVTAAVAFVDLGALNTVVALVIATFKAMLVVLFFMHVKYTSEKMTKAVIFSAIFWLLLLLILGLADFATRATG